MKYPYKLKSRFGGSCCVCDKTINKKENVMYWPDDKDVAHVQCATQGYCAGRAAFNFDIEKVSFDNATKAIKLMDPDLLEDTLDTLHDEIWHGALCNLSKTEQSSINNLLKNLIDKSEREEQAAIDSIIFKRYIKNAVLIVSAMVVILILISN